jgi:hypothetical protein
VQVISCPSDFCYMHQAGPYNNVGRCASDVLPFTWSNGNRLSYTMRRGLLELDNSFITLLFVHHIHCCIISAAGSVSLNNLIFQSVHEFTERCSLLVNTSALCMGGF